jgi:hypothetical protein
VRWPSSIHPSEQKRESVDVRRIRIGLTAAVLVTALAAPAWASKPQDGTEGLSGGHKVTICHATSSSNPDNYWHEITVDIASSGGRNKLMGHLEHANDPNKKDGRGDAIPPFSYPGFDPFPGVGQGQSGLPAACGGGPGLTTLTLIKTVDNSNGGTATVDDFQAMIDNVDVDWGTAVAVTPGSHTASEVNSLLDYHPHPWAGDCAEDGTVTLSAGDQATCTITNEFEQIG